MMGEKNDEGAFFPPGAARYCLYLAGLFVLSRAAYSVAGVRFVADLDNLIQIADPQLLTEDLFRTVLLMHSQPPLFNLFVGIIYKLFPGNIQAVLHVIYLAMGLCLCLTVYLLAIRLGLQYRLASVLAAVFTITPATILLENWTFYSYPVSLMLVLSALALNFYVETKKIAWLFVLFLLMAVVVLTRSMFHPLWMLIVPGAMYALLPGCRRRIVTAALIPVMVVGLWMAKNYYTVGGFTTSTLLGMNFYKITTMQVPDFQRVKMFANGELSRFGLYANFESLDYYRDKTGEVDLFLPSGIPALDNERKSNGSSNFNHPAYVNISSRFLHDDLSVIRHRPAAYARGVLGAISLYLQPPHDQVFNKDNVNSISPWVRVADVVLYGQLSSLWRDNYHTEFKSRIKLSKNLPDIGLFVLVALLAIMLYWPAAFVRAGRRSLSEPRWITVLFMLFAVLYVSSVANLLEIGENARIRYEIEPFIWLLAAAAFAGVGKTAPEQGSSGK
jgi:hypothetical protein